MIVPKTVDISKAMTVSSSVGQTRPAIILSTGLPVS